MNMKCLRTLLPTTFVISIMSSTAMADTVINYAITDGHSSVEDQRTVYVSNGQVRLINSPGSVDPDALYNVNSDEITLIDHQNQRYIKLSEAKIDGISNQVNNLLDGILGGLDIDTSSILGGGSAGKLETKHSGVKKNIAGVSCDMYEIKKDGQKVSDICFSSYSNLKMNTQDYETLNKMYQSGGRMAEKVRNILGDILGPIPEFNVTNHDGLPVFIQSYDNNNLQVSLKGFSEQTVNKNVFLIPTGYSETDITTLIP